MFPPIGTVIFVLTVAVNSLSPTPRINHSGNNQGDPIAKKETLANLPPVESAVVYESPDLVKKIPPPIVSSSAQLEAWFSQYSREYGADKNLLEKIAKCESGFNASSNSGYYGGMFQYSVSTWQSSRAEMGLDPNPDLRFNAEESIKTSAFKIAHGGASSWPSCSR